MEKKKKDLSELSSYLNKEVSLDNLVKVFDCSAFEIMGAISELSRSGYNILNYKKDGKIYIMNYGDNYLENEEAFYIDTNESQINLAFISDTRLCSKYQQLSILNDIYIKAKAMGVSHVLHCGDISEGVYKGKKKLYNETLFKHGVSEQSKYIIDHYPCVSDIKTLFITGEHDLTHMLVSKTDIGKIIDKGRSDMEYLGKNRKRIIIRNDSGKEILNIMMLHPTGKIPYTISYKPQRYISAMRSEDKTDILLHGHWLQTERLNFRGIVEYSVPSVVATTPEMDVEGDQNTLGVWFLKVYLNNHGLVVDTESMFVPYYKTIEDDYKNCKTLKLGSKI